MRLARCLICEQWLRLTSMVGNRCLYCEKAYRRGREDERNEHRMQGEAEVPESLSALSVRTMAARGDGEQK